MRCTKRIIFLILSPLVLLSLLFSCDSNKARISVTVIGNNIESSAVIRFADEREMDIPIDSLGKGELTLDITEPLYVTFYYQYKSPLLFLTPGADISVVFEEAESGLNTEITGKGAEESRYLNFAPLFAAQINDTELIEKEFFSLSDSLYNANLSELEKAGLSKVFNDLERERLKYFSYSTLPSYPYFHRRLTRDASYNASPEYWDKLNELMVMDASLLQYKEYRTFIAEAVERVSRNQYPDLHTLDALIKYVESEGIDPLIAEMLINGKIFRLVENYGPDVVNDSHLDAFSRFVKSPDLVEKFNALMQKWDKIAPGNISPDFSCVDIEGNKFTLDDFRGKYLYIDVWATWCGPCRMEIPHMIELEKKYHDKEITFVSISCDSDLEEWQKSVNAGMTGVQLHFDEGDTFMQDYMIIAIPHFILLDKEGKIISSNMSRPSDPETASRLDKLLK
ncbi:MAG: TlpA family protein disulfide reductase [Bacteroidales bacterium]|nr:TlpA family protein disulfide reductase [Bacteroidales bacterium]